MNIVRIAEDEPRCVRARLAIQVCHRVVANILVGNASHERPGTRQRNGQLAVGTIGTDVPQRAPRVEHAPTTAGERVHVLVMLAHRVERRDESARDPIAAREGHMPRLDVLFLLLRQPAGRLDPDKLKVLRWLLAQLRAYLPERKVCRHCVVVRDPTRLEDRFRLGEKCGFNPARQRAMLEALIPHALRAEDLCARTNRRASVLGELPDAHQVAHVREALHARPAMDVLLDREFVGLPGRVGSCRRRFTTPVTMTEALSAAMGCGPTRSHAAPRRRWSPIGAGPCPATSPHRLGGRTAYRKLPRRCSWDPG